MGCLRGEAAEIEDWIGHQLPRPMKRYVASAIALEYLNSALCEKFRRRNDVCSFGIAP